MLTSSPTAAAIPAAPMARATEAGANADALIERRCRLAIAIAAARAGVTIDVLLSPSRSTAPVALARQHAMYLAHVGLGLAQADVARVFRRDRSTVAHACRRIEDLRDKVDVDRDLGRMEACLRWAAEA